MRPEHQNNNDTLPGSQWLQEELRAKIAGWHKVDTRKGGAMKGQFVNHFAAPYIDAKTAEESRRRQYERSQTHIHYLLYLDAQLDVKAVEYRARGCEDFSNAADQTASAKLDEVAKLKAFIAPLKTLDLNFNYTQYVADNAHNFPVIKRSGFETTMGSQVQSIRNKIKNEFLRNLKRELEYRKNALSAVQSIFEREQNGSSAAASQKNNQLAEILAELRVRETEYAIRVVKSDMGYGTYKATDKLASTRKMIAEVEALKTRVAKGETMQVAVNFDPGNAATSDKGFFRTSNLTKLYGRLIKLAPKPAVLSDGSDRKTVAKRGRPVRLLPLRKQLKDLVPTEQSVSEDQKLQLMICGLLVRSNPPIVDGKRYDKRDLTAIIMPVLMFVVKTMRDGSVSDKKAALEKMKKDLRGESRLESAGGRNDSKAATLNQYYRVANRLLEDVTKDSAFRGLAELCNKDDAEIERLYAQLKSGQGSAVSSTRDQRDAVSATASRSSHSGSVFGSVPSPSSSPGFDDDSHRPSAEAVGGDEDRDLYADRDRSFKG